MHGPYHKPSSAAAYLGQSKKEWETLLAMFDVPRCGPLANVYAQSDLDDLMACPQKYLKAKRQTKTKPADTRPVKDRVASIIASRKAS